MPFCGISCLTSEIRDFFTSIHGSVLFLFFHLVVVDKSVGSRLGPNHCSNASSSAKRSCKLTSPNRFESMKSASAMTVTLPRLIAQRATNCPSVLQFAAIAWSVPGDEVRTS